MNESEVATSLPKVSPVDEAFASLEMEVSKNYDLISSLESRIDKVLCSNKELKENMKDGVPSSSKIVAIIDSLASRMRMSNGLLREIRDRVEL